MPAVGIGRRAGRTSDATRGDEDVVFVYLSLLKPRSRLEAHTHFVRRLLNRTRPRGDPPGAPPDPTLYDTWGLSPSRHGQARAGTRGHARQSSSSETPLHNRLDDPPRLALCRAGSWEVGASSPRWLGQTRQTGGEPRKPKMEGGPGGPSLQIPKQIQG